MISLADALKDRISAAHNGTIEAQIKFEGREYQKKWAEAVQFFQKSINSDRKRDTQSSLPALSFIAVRQKLAHVRDIDDLRWFYKQCLAYSRKKDPNKVQIYTFSKCFFGALKIRE